MSKEKRIVLGARGFLHLKTLASYSVDRGESKTGRVNNFETTGFSIHCSDSTRPMRAIDRPSSVGPGRHMTPCGGSSGVTIALPVAACPVGFSGGLIHTAVGRVSRRGEPCTNRSGCAA